MPARDGEAQLARSSEPLWWGLAALLSLISLWLPRYIRLDGDAAAETLVTQAALVFTGAFVGTMRPRRLWRWPVAAFVSLTIYEFTLMSRSPEFLVLESGQFWTLAFQECSKHSLHAIAVLVGACAGARLSSGGLE